MHKVCEIAAEMSDGVLGTGRRTLHRTLFSNTVRTPSVQALFGETFPCEVPWKKMVPNLWSRVSQAATPRCCIDWRAPCSGHLFSSHKA